MHFNDVLSERVPLEIVWDGPPWRFPNGLLLLDRDLLFLPAAIFDSSRGRAGGWERAHDGPADT